MKKRLEQLSFFSSKKEAGTLKIGIIVLVIALLAGASAIKLRAEGPSDAAVTSSVYAVSNDFGGLNGSMETISNVPFGTSLADFLAAIEFLPGQTYDTQFMSDPVVTGDSLPVSSQDGATEIIYMIEANLDSSKAIISFDIEGGATVINESAKTILVVMPNGTDLAALIAYVNISGVSVSPASGMVVDFTNPVTYTVTAEDGSTQAYVATVKLQSQIPPVIAAHDDVFAESDSSEGVVVNFAAPIAADNVDAPADAVCSPESGSLFAVGTTTVICTKTDSDGNEAEPVIFFITVVNISAPTVIALGDGTADYEIPASSTADLIFSKPLSEESKLAVQNAITAGADQELAFNWSEDGSVLMITGNASSTTIFANDVSAENLADPDGNTAASLLLINSFEEEIVPGEEVLPEGDNSSPEVDDSPANNPILTENNDYVVLIPGPVIPPSITAINVPLVISEVQEGTLIKNIGIGKIEIRVPRGTVATTTTFNVIGNPSGVSANSIVYGITAVDANGFPVKFAKSIKVILSDLSLPDVSNLGVYYFDAASNKWAPITEGAVDSASGMAVFITGHLSDFAVISSNKLNAPEEKQEIVYKNGTLLRAKGDVRIYVIADGKKHHIRSLAELKEYKGKPILNVDASVLSAY